jgi:Sulfatase
MTYYAEQSCTAGRNSFITGMHPLRTGMIPPQLPSSPSYLRPGTPCLAKFLLDLGYTTGEFGKNHLGDHPDALPTAHGFQEFWGYFDLSIALRCNSNASSGDAFLNRVLPTSVATLYVLRSGKIPFP